MSERWLPVVGYEGLYEVSDHGRVRSKDHVVVRSNGTPQTITGRIRKAGLALHGGYPALRLARDGVKKNFTVHYLVARAFIGPRPSGKEVAHWDGDPENARLANLRYATPVENDSDKIRHGTRPQGERNGHAILTPGDIIQIRYRVSLGEMNKIVAADYGVSASHICMIVKRRTWRHI